MIAKRLFDFFAAAIGLVLLAPLFMLIALWIKVDSPGPVVFLQDRVGKDGCIFRMWKFRSMKVSTTGPLLTVGADARITRAGRFIRHYKLDELPQLVNVLRGDMSLVGPRPEVPRYVAFYSDQERKEVLSVRPGITDPASIAFANESEVLARSADPEYAYVHEVLPMKIAQYRTYIKNRTFIGDFAIVLRTLIVAAVGSRHDSRGHR